jgi:hypothetical protein
MGLRRVTHRRALTEAGVPSSRRRSHAAFPPRRNRDRLPTWKWIPCVVEGHDAHITVSGAGCAGGDEAAQVEIHFIYDSRMPPELTAISRCPRPVTDAVGAWSSEIVVPSAGLVSLLPGRRHSVAIAFISHHPEDWSQLGGRAAVDRTADHGEGG